MSLSPLALVPPIPRMVSGPVFPWIIAHRGASADAPENTLAAVRLAWEQGADAVEVDLRLTRDGQVVVLHDATTRRTADGELAVAGATLAQLRALDAGSFKGAAWRGEPIPTLREVLASVPPGRRIVLELKNGAELLGPLAADLAAAGAADGLPLERVVLITFQEEVARLAKARLRAASVLWLADPRRARLGEGLPQTVRRLVATASRAGLDGLHLCAHPGLHAGLVEEAHAARLSLFVWTVDHPAEAERLLRAGVDAITTDVPGTLLGVRAAWRAE